MNTAYKVISALAVVIVITAALGYIYLSNPTLGQNQTNTTPTPTVQPTANPTNVGNPSPTAKPSATANPSSTTSPTANPTATPSPTPVPQAATIYGAGASFPYPLISNMITDYRASNPWATVDYQSIGSGGGISALTQKTVDYAGSDAPLTASEAANAPNALHIPETIGAVTVTYNLPGISSGLKLTGQVIADIYMGTITNWNDSAIRALNPSTNLPNHDIVVVHRGESSGTSFVFTGFLSASSTAWANGPGQGKSVAWPIGTASQGNSGVAGVVEGNAYTIGYVELAYTVQNQMKVAAVKNPAGNYVIPTLATTTAAAQSVASAGLPAGSASWTGVNILNAPGADSYPIVSFSYIIVYKELNVISSMTQAKAELVTRFLWYMVHTGQNQATPLTYAALPANVVAIDEATINSITFNGQPLPH